MRETTIQKSIVRIIEAHGGFVIRQNAGRGRYNQHLAPPGTPDLLVLLPGGRTVWNEIKTAERKLRAEQAATHDRLRELGQVVMTARGIEDVADFLDSRSVL
jgi:hypothetical protein